MEPIIAAGSPVVWVIVRAAHSRVGKRIRPALALLTGVALAAIYAAFGQIAWGDIIMAGPTMGLAASGLHSGVRTTTGAR